MLSQTFLPSPLTTIFQDLVKLLNEEELEILAQTSYAYWLASLSQDHPPTADQRERMALREVRRQSRKSADDDAKVLHEIKETAKHRKEQRYDLIRASAIENSIMLFESEEERAEMETELAKIRAAVDSDLKKQASYIRGKDKEGRALLVGRSRLVADTVHEEFLMTQLYLIERGLAATEFNTKGKEEKMVVVLDFSEFYASLSPAWESIKALAHILGNFYPERLIRTVVTDPPFWVRTSYNMLTPFIDPITLEKYILVYGDEGKQLLKKYFDPEQAMPFMIPEGKLSESVDLQQFQRVVPFFCCYDTDRT